MFENLEAGVHIGDHEHYKNWPGRTEIQSSACLTVIFGKVTRVIQQHMTLYSKFFSKCQDEKDILPCSLLDIINTGY